MFGACCADRTAIQRRVKALWFLLGVGACAQPDLPAGVTSSRTLATSVNILADGTVDPVVMDFDVGVSPDSDILEPKTDATVMVVPNGSDPVDLPLVGDRYRMKSAGFAPSYAIDIRAGHDYVHLGAEMPPLVTLSIDDGDPVTVRWGDADPSLTYTLTVLYEDDAGYVFAEARDNEPDPGQLAIPATVFEDTGMYVIEVQRVRTVRWWDDDDCSLGDCSRTSSGLGATTVARATWTR
jgi:hypothetical protein